MQAINNNQHKPVLGKNVQMRGSMVPATQNTGSVPVYQSNQNIPHNRIQLAPEAQKKLNQPIHNSMVNLAPNYGTSGTRIFNSQVVQPTNQQQTGQIFLSQSQFVPRYTTTTNQQPNTQIVYQSSPRTYQNYVTSNRVIQQSGGPRIRRYQSTDKLGYLRDSLYYPSGARHIDSRPIVLDEFDRRDYPDRLRNYRSLDRKYPLYDSRLRASAPYNLWDREYDNIYNDDSEYSYLRRRDLRRHRAQDLLDDDSYDYDPGNRWLPNRGLRWPRKGILRRSGSAYPVRRVDDKVDRIMHKIGDLIGKGKWKRRRNEERNTLGQERDFSPSELDDKANELRLWRRDKNRSNTPPILSDLDQERKNSRSLERNFPISRKKQEDLNRQLARVMSKTKNRNLSGDVLDDDDDSQTANINDSAYSNSPARAGITQFRRTNKDRLDTYEDEERRKEKLLKKSIIKLFNSSKNKPGQKNDIINLFAGRLGKNKLRGGYLDDVRHRYDLDESEDYDDRDGIRNFFNPIGRSGGYQKRPRQFFDDFRGGRNTLLRDGNRWDRDNARARVGRFFDEERDVRGKRRGGDGGGRKKEILRKGLDELLRLAGEGTIGNKNDKTHGGRKKKGGEVAEPVPKRKTRKKNWGARR